MRKFIDFLLLLIIFFLALDLFSNFEFDLDRGGPLLISTRTNESISIGVNSPDEVKSFLADKISFERVEKLEKDDYERFYDIAVEAFENGENTFQVTFTDQLSEKM